MSTPIQATVPPMQVWQDEPADADLLGFGVVAATVVSLVRDERLDPVTVGVFSPWGGGKSTVLHLVDTELKRYPRNHVVRVNPWQYDDFVDVRERLVSDILAQLPADEPGRKEKLAKLVRRVRWTSVARTLGMSALAGAVNPMDLLESLTLKEDEPERLLDMSGFRKDFADFIKSDDAHDRVRVVVLVDDLDRCLPPATVAVMEALKLFLSVPKMSFVLAVDHSLIRSSLQASEQASGRSEFADRYLEKIVQVPISLPVLSQSDAVTYVALLLLQRILNDDPGAFESVRAQVEGRRSEGLLPALDPTIREVADNDVLPIAEQVVHGLKSDSWSSPRAIKRFLNAWGVRVRIAHERGVTLDSSVSLKLMILEERYPQDFRVLAETAPEDRLALLRKWESWALGTLADGGGAEAGTGTPLEKPERISPESLRWAKAAPAIHDEVMVTRYLTLAATFGGFAVASSMSEAELDAFDKLVNSTEAIRRAGTIRLNELSEASAKKVGAALVERLPKQSEPEMYISALLAVVAKAPAFADEAARAIEAVKKRLTPGDVVRLTQCTDDAIKTLVGRLADDTSLPAKTRRAFKEALGST